MQKIILLANAALALALLNTVLAEDAPQPAFKTIPPAKSELPEMVTDRPDFTEATDVVGKGVVQMENGFTQERSRGGTSISGPELLMRIGLTKCLEIRIGGDGFLSQRSLGAARISGYSDVELAAKIVVFNEGRHRPALSLIPLLSLPLGSPDFSSGDYDPGLKVALGKDLPKGFSLGGNVNVSSLTTPDGRFLQTAFSASLGHGLRRGFRGYWEIFGLTPWQNAGSAAWLANAGVTHSIGKHAQIDARAGKRLTDVGPDWFWGFGMAFRQPDWTFFRSLRPTS